MIPRFLYMFIPIFGPHFYETRRQQHFHNSFFAVEANVNSIIDKLLAWVQKHFRENGYDPYSLEDSIIWNRSIKFPYEVEWKNVFGVYSGEVLNLSTIHRSDDASLEFIPGSNVFELRGRVAFDKVQIIYDFAAKLMNLGPTGHLIGVFPSLRARYVIKFFPTTLTTELKRFDLDETKEMDLSLEGFGLLNEWILLCIVIVLDHLSVDYRTRILKTLEKKLRINLEKSLKIYDDDEQKRRKSESTNKRHRESDSDRQNYGIYHRRRKEKGDGEKKGEKKKRGKVDGVAPKKDESEDGVNVVPVDKKDKEKPNKNEKMRQKKGSSEKESNKVIFKSRNAKDKTENSTIESSESSKKNSKRDHSKGKRDDAKHGTEYNNKGRKRDHKKGDKSDTEDINKEGVINENEIGSTEEKIK